MPNLGPWLLRAAWVVQPFAAGPLLADALADAGQPLRTTASVALWVVWGATLVATLVPRTATLTAIRIVIPGATLAAAWAAADTSVDSGAVAALSIAVLAAALALLPSVGAAFVDGSSYGDERRLPLRVGAPLLFGPVELAWLVAVAGPVVGPLALLDRRWVVGVVATAVGLPAAAVAVRALHHLSRRWVVFVPAGVVLHDRAVLPEPVLFTRATVTAIGPAPADTAARDLTNQATGLALRLRLAPPVTLPATAAASGSHDEEVDEILFTPTRPGWVLEEARSRRFAIS